MIIGERPDDKDHMNYIFYVMINFRHKNSLCHLSFWCAGLFLEEEITSALYLLRMILKDSLQRKFPKMSNRKFILSAVVHLAMGYIYLFNMFLVIAQATSMLAGFVHLQALSLEHFTFQQTLIEYFSSCFFFFGYLL